MAGGFLTGDGLKSLHGSLLIGLITSVCSSGFLLFGYDQGVMSGVVISDNWLQTMGNPSNLIVGTITALYDVGAIVGAIIAAFVAEPLGRKRTLIFGSVLVLLGAVLMGSSFTRAQFMVARIVVGIGIGFCTSVTPVYQSEVSSTEQRGWQVCCQLTTMLGGIVLSYWMNYGLYFRAGSIQWRFPLAFQCVFCIYILAVTPFLPDTPRWLMRHNETPERGLAVLARLRGKDSSDRSVQREKDEIMQALALESQEEGSWADLFRSNGISAHKRFFLALGIQFMQQMTGINIVTYYAPTLYKTSLGMSQQMSLFLGGFTQVWYILASFVTWYTIDRVGRRKLFIINALGMTVVLICEAICVGIGGSSAAVAAVVFVFLFEGCFTWGWMACVWVYPPEILPLKIRAKGAALAAAADFLGNFLVVEVTPVGVSSIGWRFYVIWAVLNLVNAVIVWAVYPETAGLQLESVDRIFTAAVEVEGDVAKPIGLRKLQWSRVHIAREAVRRNKAAYRAGSLSEDLEDEVVGNDKGIAGTTGSDAHYDK